MNDCVQINKFDLRSKIVSMETEHKGLISANINRDN
jgi:hypothetical protein